MNQLTQQKEKINKKDTLVIKQHKGANQPGYKDKPIETTQSHKSTKDENSSKNFKEAGSGVV